MSRGIALQLLIVLAERVIAAPQNAFDHLPAIIVAHEEVVEAAEVIVATALLAIAPRPLSQVSIMRFSKIITDALPELHDRLFVVVAAEARAEGHMRGVQP